MKSLSESAVRAAACFAPDCYHVRFEFHPYRSGSSDDRPFATMEEAQAFVRTIYPEALFEKEFSEIGGEPLLMGFWRDALKDGTPLGHIWDCAQANLE